MLFDAPFNSAFTSPTGPTTEFVVFRDGTTEEDAVFDVDPVVDTANPFGDYCVIKMDDRGGQKFENYERGTRVDVEIRSEEGIIERFTGYVVERRETEQSGADVLEVEAYSFDQFLRRNTATNDQRGNTITEALADIIQTDTPVSYVAGNVTVGDDQELTRSYQGESVENVLRDLAFKSNNEDFGVNDSLEFFFRPRETVHIDRGIDNTQWFNYDIPELGKEAINEVEVWFDDGEESVIVDDGTDKLDLQDSLGLPSPGTQRAELNRPLITDIGDAEDIGRKYLSFKNATLSGTVTTYGLFDAEPGDTIDITIDPRGIDAEFVIAGIEYRWGRDETILTIVEKRGDVDDILSELNDSVQRQEMESANRDAPKNRITTTNATALVDVSVDYDNGGSGGISNQTVVPYAAGIVGDLTASIQSPTLSDGESAEVEIEVFNDGVLVDSDFGTATTTTGQTDQATASISLTGAQFDELTFRHAGDANAGYTFDVSLPDDASDVRFVNDGRNAVRDTWTGDSPPDITTIVVGDDNTGLSRSNTALSNQTNSAAVSQTLPDAKSVEFSASITQTGVQEIGLETSGGTLITRATFDTAVDLDGTVTITLTVSNDDSVSRGVLTNDGQTAVRDALADNAPALPTDYGYGSDGAAVAETDTALGNELVTVPLDKVSIQDADTQTEWENLLSLSPTDPLYIESGLLKLAQTAFVQEGEADIISGTRASGDYSNGEATFIENGTSNDGSLDPADTATVSFDLDYTIPESHVAINFRIEPTDGTGDGISDTPEFTVSIDGTTLITEQLNTNNLSLEWDDFGSSWSGGDLTAGSHTLTIEVTDASAGTADDELLFDLFAVYDDRFPPTFDNNNGGSGGYLDGPELFPSVQAQSFPTATSRRNADEARFELTANDVSNNFYVELSGDGGATFSRINNSQTGNVTFADLTQSVDTNVALGRTDETRTTATPQTGFNGQQIDVWELFVFVNAVATDNIGETLSRAIVPPDTAGIVGNTVREAGLKNGSTLLTRHELAEFVLESGQRLASSETSKFVGDN